MSLTTAEKLLMEGLGFFDMKKGSKVLALMLMDTEDKRWNLINFLADHKDATEDEIVAEAYRIAAT